MVKQAKNGEAREGGRQRQRGVKEDTGEAARLARAIGHVLGPITHSAAARCGDELLELVEQHVPGPHVDLVADPTRPTLAELHAVGKVLGGYNGPATDLDRRLGWLCEELGFDEIDHLVLATLARCTMFDSWRRLVQVLQPWSRVPTLDKLAVLTGLPATVVGQHLGPGSRLRGSRLVEEGRHGEIEVTRLFSEIVRRPVRSREELAEWLMPEDDAPALAWEDFAHVPLRELAASVLGARRPVSLLLFGEPGTGKTEFARRLAHEAGCRASFAGGSNESAGEPDRRERIAHLMVLRALSRTRADRLIIVDEADDILAPSHREFGSKQWVNRLVEDPQVPTIWIVNDPDRLDLSVRRRMTLAIGFERPPASVRRRMVTRAAQSRKLVLTDSEAHQLASLPVNPGVIASGLSAACLAGGGAELAHQAITSVAAAMGQPVPGATADNSVYDPALAAADVDLATLTDRLSATPRRGWSLLLHGPSGTGKSAWARHLAERMNVDVEERRASDLISSYIGETEINIAKAFAQATARGAMLLIDEIDSFLYRREAGQRSWERAQVNEMLVRMEHLATPFVATTNLPGQVDPAARRRFTVRVAFRAMNRPQVLALFGKRFGGDWPAGQAVPEGLTPGDFAVVARRAELLGEANTPVLAAWLGEEAAGRQGTAGPVGFVVAPLG